MNFQITTEIDVLTFISGSLSTIGAYFLVRGVLSSSAHQMARLSGTYLSSNPHQARSLAEQKADTLVGFSFVFASGLFWIACAVMKLTIEATATSYAVLALADVISFLLCLFLSGKYRRALRLKTVLINFVHTLASELKYPENFDEKQLADLARQQGLESYFNGATDPFECLMNCAVAGGASPGAKLIDEIRQSRKNPK